MSYPLKFEFYEHPPILPRKKPKQTLKPRMDRPSRTQSKVLACNLCRKRRRKCERINGPSGPCFRCKQEGQVEKCTTTEDRRLCGRKPGSYKKIDPVFQNTFYEDMHASRPTSPPSASEMTGLEQQERQESYSLISYPNLDSTAPMAPDHDHLDGEHYLVPSYEGLPPDTVTGYVGLPMAYSENNHHANYYQPGCEITVAPPSQMYATSSGPEYYHDDFLHSYLETSFPSQWNYDQCFFSGDEHYN